MLILHLSTCILILTFLGFSSTSPTESKLPFLSESTFQSTVSKGTWFVRYSSPRSPRCQWSDPVWKQLAETFSKLDEFRFANVDCDVEKNLCENESQTYPSFLLYKDGERRNEYPGDMAYEALAEYVMALNGIKAVTADGSLKRNNPVGEVAVLNDQNVNETIGSGPWLVEFFAPWCGHCKKLAPVWQSLGKRLKNKVNIGSVDCTVQKAICDEHGIRGYPTIKFVQSDTAVDYRGGRALENLESFAIQASLYTVPWVQVKDLPQLERENAASFIYIYDKNTPTDTKNIFTTLAKGLGLSHPIYTSSNAELISALKSKATSLLVLKDGQTKRYDGSLQDVTAMRSWIQAENVPRVSSTSASSIFGTAFGFIMVALCWGGTNPFIRNGTQGLQEAMDRLPKNTSKIGKTVAEWKFLLTRWHYVVPLALNLSGSVVYYYFLGKADLSLAVPITNSLTFLFTTLVGAMLGEDVGGTETWLGMALVVAGVALCVSSKVIG